MNNKEQNQTTEDSLAAKPIKRGYLLSVSILISAIIIAGAWVYTTELTTSNTSQKASNVLNNVDEKNLAEEIYPLFFCPCCGQPLDPNNICCGTAEEMIDYIDSLVANGISKKEVILKMAGKYGITSVIESERDEIKAELAKRNPELFPKESLTFQDAIGKQAPDFSLESIDGKTIKLSDYRGKNVVLFFNEGTMCYPACWDQIAELGNDDRFNTNNLVAFSVVVDQKSEWEKIVRQAPQFSNAKILFDTSKAVSLAYDVLSLKSSMHPGSFPGHTYFVIDKEGIVRYVLDDPNMAIRNDLIISELSKLGEE